MQNEQITQSKIEFTDLARSLYELSVKVRKQAFIKSSCEEDHYGDTLEDCLSDLLLEILFHLWAEESGVETGSREYDDMMDEFLSAFPIFPDDNEQGREELFSRMAETVVPSFFEKDKAGTLPDACDRVISECAFRAKEYELTRKAVNERFFKEGTKPPFQEIGENVMKLLSDWLSENISVYEPAVEHFRRTESMAKKTKKE